MLFFIYLTLIPYFLAELSQSGYSIWKNLVLRNFFLQYFSKDNVKTYFYTTFFYIFFVLSGLIVFLFLFKGFYPLSFLLCFERSFLFFAFLFNLHLPKLVCFGHLFMVLFLNIFSNTS